MHESVRIFFLVFGIELTFEAIPELIREAVSAVFHVSRAECKKEWTLEWMEACINEMTSG